MPLPMEPEPGYLAVRFTKGGPLVACRVIHDGRLWFLFIGGKMVGAPHSDGWKVSPLMETVAFSRRRITQSEYAALLVGADTATAGDPLAEPSVAVDLRSSPPLYRKKP